MLNRSLNRLKYANKPRDPVPAVGGELGVCRKGGTLWSAENCRGAACLVGMLAHQQWGTWGMCPVTGLVEINVLWWPVYPRGIKIWCQVASKQMGETFPWRRSTKVKCHMSEEGISNLIHNRQKQWRRINRPSEISGVNIEKEPQALFLEKLPFPLSGFQSSPVVKG